MTSPFYQERATIWSLDGLRKTNVTKKRDEEPQAKVLQVIMGKRDGTFWVILGRNQAALHPQLSPLAGHG
jgi:hypothetical protein